jgi:hypothetical protein
VCYGIVYNQWALSYQSVGSDSQLLLQCHPCNSCHLCILFSSSPFPCRFGNGERRHELCLRTARVFTWLDIREHPPAIPDE